MSSSAPCSTFSLYFIEILSYLYRNNNNKKRNATEFLQYTKVYFSFASVAQEKEARDLKEQEST
jgi:negative regulator of replication initiation